MVNVSLARFNRVGIESGGFSLSWFEFRVEQLKNRALFRSG